ncbi:MAG: Slp family lipoprotein [Nitrospiraceae bacterium]|nr:Slp family lipoprotein [Nitrospiraceae bacterium]
MKSFCKKLQKYIKTLRPLLIRMLLFRTVWMLLPVALISSCVTSPIRKAYLEHAIINPSISVLQQNPGLYRGKLFLLGGSILNTTVTAEGSFVYAIYLPVDPDGVPQGYTGRGGRFIAMMPGSKGTLDPLVYKKDSRITVAGEFVGLRKGTLDKSAYDYPVFRVEQIYLWNQEQYQPYYYPYYRPSYYYNRYPYYYPYSYPYY